MADISEKLKMDILEGRFGDEIISESEIAAQYSVSRSSSKDALVKLTHIGMLSSVPRCGYKPVSRTYREYLDMLRIRLNIESMCVREIIRNNSFDFTELEKIWQSGAQARSLRETYLYNRAFHKELSKQSGITYADTVLDDIDNKCGRFFFRYYSIDYPTAIKKGRDNHRLLMESIKKGDEKEACDILQKDIMTIREELERLIEPSRKNKTYAVSNK